MNEIVSIDNITIQKENYNLSIISIDSSERILVKGVTFTNCTFVNSIGSVQNSVSAWYNKKIKGW